MNLTTKLLCASLLTVGAISAQAATPNFVYGGNMSAEPARAVVPHQAGDNAAIYVSASGLRKVAQDVSLSKPIMPTAVDARARARAYVG